MTPQIVEYLNKARQSLHEAELIFKTGLTNQASRCAYMASFHAAQAYIFHASGKIAKTHNGVQTEFMRLVKDIESLRPFAVFLSQAYNLKAVADYETGPDSVVSAERTATAIADAKKMLDAMAKQLEAKA